MKEERNLMRKRIRLLIAALMMALTMSFAGVASALEEGNGRGNPDTTKSGHCPPGANKDTSTGGLKKCD
jgi:hypothetical protein